VEYASEGATLLLNSPYGPNEVWNHFSVEIQREIIARKLKCFVIDAYPVAKASGMGGRINTIMQTCFFAISNVLPREEAIEAIRESIRHTYGRKGEDVVQKNMQAVDTTLAHLFEVKIPEKVSSTTEIPAAFPGAPRFEHDVLGTIYAGRGDELPVSAFSCDGTFPTGTAKWEKRNHGSGDSGLGYEDLHPVRQVRDGLPACRDPDQGLRQQRTGTARPQPSSRPTVRDKEWAGHEVHDPGRSRRLHRMRRLRRCLPGQKQE
jgi:hypothetical protein